MMTMTLEQSLQWQADSEATYVASLRAGLDEFASDEVIKAMAALYRAGWDDCFKLAQLNGVDRRGENDGLLAALIEPDA